MSKYDKVNEALNDVNDVTSTYDFIDWDKNTTKEHIQVTKENLQEIIDACNTALKEIGKVE